MAALLAGDPEQAVTSLAAVWQHTVREGVADPGAFPVAGDLAEALAETGRLGEAAQVIGRLAGLAAAQQHPWGLATADRFLDRRWARPRISSVRAASKPSPSAR